MLQSLFTLNARTPSSPASQLVQFVRIISIAYMVVLLMRVMLLPQAGAFTASPLAIIPVLLVAVVVVLPWQHWIQTTPAVQRYVWTTTVLVYVLCIGLSWTTATIGWWVYPLVLSTFAPAMLSLVLGTRAPASLWNLSKPQIAAVVGWSIAGVGMWWAALHGPGQAPREALLMLRVTFSTMAVIWAWYVLLHAIVFKRAEPEFRFHFLVGYLVLVALFVFFNNTFLDSLVANSNLVSQRPFLLWTWLPLLVMAGAVWNFRAHSKTVSVAIAVSIAWSHIPIVANPGLAFSALPVLAVMWPLLVNSRRWQFPFIGWGLTLLAYAVAPDLDHQQLLMHGMSGTAIFLLTVALVRSASHAKAAVANVPGDSTSVPMINPAKLEKRPSALAVVIGILTPAIGISAHDAPSVQYVQAMILLGTLLGLGTFSSIKLLLDRNARQQDLKELANLRQTEALHHRLSLAMQTAGLGWFEMDRASRTMTLDPQAAKVWGFSNYVHGHVMPIEDVLNVIHEEDRWLLVQSWEATNTGDSASQLQFRCKWPDGTEHWIEAQFNQESSDASQVVRRWGFVRDITTSQLASAKLKEALLHAETQSRLMQKILTSAPMAVRIARLSDNRVVFLNQAFCHLVQRSASEAKELDISQFYVDPAAFTAIRQRLAWGDNVFNELVELHIPDRPEAQHVWALASYMVIDFNHQKAVLAWLFDVTEMQTAKSLAHEASLAKSAFLANMSHEIRTPLAAVIGLLQVLGQTPLSSTQVDYVHKIDGAAKTLLGLLNDILDFSKIDAGKLDIDSQPVPLDPLFRDLSVVLAANVGGKPIDVLYDLDPALPAEVMGDVLRLKQIFVNLGGNAIKFTESGQVVIAAKLLKTKTPAHAEDGSEIDWIEFRIADSGIGIARENISKLFSAFTQAESATTRKFGGTGLGLAICRRLIELMGGNIRVESELGWGTTFVLEIPFKRATRSALLPTTPTSASQPQHVLLVDDNPVAGLLISQTLKSFGWEVVHTSSGIKAVGQLAEHLDGRAPPFTQVYIDSSLAGVDGWETLHQMVTLLEAAQRPLPKFVMLSPNGRDHLGTRTAGEQSLLAHYMVKPVTPSMLLEASQRSAGDGRTVQMAKIDNKRELEGLRILVVEDNAINQQVAEELLSSQGATVAIAANGLEGTTAVKSADPPYDIVLMDIQMPIMDGYTAARFIRSDLQLDAHTLPIIGLTANAMTSDRQRCLDAGMNDHIGKPFELERLVSAIVHLTRGGAAPVSEESLEAQGQHNAPELELAKALARMGGRESLFVRTARQWINTIPTQIAQLEHAIEAVNRQTALELIHSLKGTSGTMGLSRLSKRLAKLEAHLRELKTGESFAEPTLGLDGELRAAATLLDEAIAALTTSIAPEQMAQAAGSAVAGPVREQLQMLASLLEAGDFEALTVFADASDLLQSMPDDDFSALEESMQSLDMDSALEICKRLLAA